jgi:hypothetical protein
VGSGAQSCVLLPTHYMTMNTMRYDGYKTQSVSDKNTFPSHHPGRLNSLSHRVSFTAISLTFHAMFFMASSISRYRGDAIG